MFTCFVFVSKIKIVQHVCSSCFDDSMQAFVPSYFSFPNPSNFVLLWQHRFQPTNKQACKNSVIGIPTINGIMVACVPVFVYRLIYLRVCSVPDLSNRIVGNEKKQDFAAKK